MKCGNCSHEHASVSEVSSCYKRGGTYSKPCKHELPYGQCICAWRSRPYNWSKSFSLKYPTVCCFCRNWMETGDKACKRGSRIAHSDCIADPAAYEEDYRNITSLGIPDYGNIPDNLSILAALADALAPEMEAEIASTTKELLDCIEADMGECICDLVEEAVCDHLALTEG